MYSRQGKASGGLVFTVPSRHESIFPFPAYPNSDASKYIVSEGVAETSLSRIISCQGSRTVQKVLTGEPESDALRCHKLGSEGK